MNPDWFQNNCSFDLLTIQFSGALPIAYLREAQVAMKSSDVALTPM